MKFEVELNWEVEEGLHLDLIVNGNQQPYRPASRRGHPDTWTPAEGGEMDDVKITFKNRHGEFPLPDFMAKPLLDDESFVRALEEKISRHNS